MARNITVIERPRFLKRLTDEEVIIMFDMASLDMGYLFKEIFHRETLPISSDAKGIMNKLEIGENELLDILEKLSRYDLTCVEEYKIMGGSVFIVRDYGGE